MNKLVTGDCVDGMNALLPASADLVFADPPFNIGFDYGVGEYKDKLADDEYLQWCRRWLVAIWYVLKPTGTFWLAIGDEYVSELDVLAKEIGFFKRSHICWYYTFGVNSPNKFTRSHTQLLYFTKHKTKFTFNAPDVRVPSARALVYKDKRANPDGRLPDDTWILRPQEIPEGFPDDHDTWHYPRIAGSFHRRQPGAANQMPEQLLGRVIRACSNTNDVVLDPFTGTGTTLVVAKKLGRKYIGYELSEAFAKAARKRIAAAKLDEPLDTPIPKD